MGQLQIQPLEYIEEPKKLSIESWDMEQEQFGLELIEVYNGLIKDLYQPDDLVKAAFVNCERLIRSNISLRKLLSDLVSVVNELQTKVNELSGNGEKE